MVCSNSISRSRKEAHLTSATIIRPGRAPSYYSGDNFGGSLITPGQPASQFSHDGMGGTTIITPGQAPVYIRQY